MSRPRQSPVLPHSALLIEFRQLIEVTQQELADALGVHIRRVAMWESTSERPSRDNWNALADLAKAKGAINFETAFRSIAAQKDVDYSWLLAGAMEFKKAMEAATTNDEKRELGQLTLNLMNAFMEDFTVPHPGSYGVPKGDLNKVRKALSKIRAMREKILTNHARSVEPTPLERYYSALAEMYIRSKEK